MAIDALKKKTLRQVHEHVSGVAARDVDDWDAWLAADEEQRPRLFGHLLRKWQATRPRPIRRLRAEAEHEGPFLEDLLALAAADVKALEALTLLNVRERTEDHAALANLWATFRQLPTSGAASCVGITKAILLVTDGRIGPGLDSQVRRKLGVAVPTTCEEWVRILQDIGEDIAAFESIHGSLAHAVPPRYAQLAYGRLYDMALGSR